MRVGNAMGLAEEGYIVEGALRGVFVGGAFAKEYVRRSICGWGIRESPLFVACGLAKATCCSMDRAYRTREGTTTSGGRAILSLLEGNVNTQRMC